MNLIPKIHPDASILTALLEQPESFRRALPKASIMLVPTRHLEENVVVCSYDN